MSGMLEILRLNHRPERDKRISTHICLVARAFGADGVVISTPDVKIEKNIASVNKRFGGEFFVRTGVDWRKYLRDFKGIRVHLTMYGSRLDEAIGNIREHFARTGGTGKENLLIVVGASKVPASVYSMADFNVSVGNQPHSEVAALALFLDRWFCGNQLGKDFGGPMKILPSPRGKQVVDRTGNEEE